MLFVVEIAMLVGGAYALLTGKMPGFFFGNKYVVEGSPARIIGFVFMIPLPLAFVISLIFVAVAGSDGVGSAWIVEIGLIAVCLIAGLLYGNRVKKLKTETPPAIPGGGPTP